MTILKNERRKEEVKIDRKVKYMSVMHSFCRHFYSLIVYQFYLVYLWCSVSGQIYNSYFKLTFRSLKKVMVIHVKIKI